MKYRRDVIEQSGIEISICNYPYILIVLLTVVVLGVCFTPIELSSAQLKRNNNLEESYSKKSNQESSELQLKLLSEKKNYMIGEEIVFTVYIENLDQEKSFYIGKSFYSLALHEITFMVHDVIGRTVPQPIYSFDPIPTYKNTTLTKLIEDRYMILLPNRLYGEKISKTFDNLKPGIYKIKAIYHEYIQDKSKDLSSLSIPIWIKPLVSNEVIVNIKNKRLK